MGLWLRYNWLNFLKIPVSMPYFKLNRKPAVSFCIQETPEKWGTFCKALKLICWQRVSAIIPPLRGFWDIHSLLYLVQKFPLSECLLFSLWCQCCKCGLHRTIAFFNPYHTCLLLVLFHTICMMGTGGAYVFGPLGVHHLCHTGYTYVVLLPYLLLSKKQKLTLTSWLLFL